MSANSNSRNKNAAAAAKDVGAGKSATAGNAAEENVIVKKVKAYPIAAKISVDATSAEGRIVKLTEQGFLIEVQLPNCKPGDKAKIDFELPVLHHVIQETCILIKLYNQFIERQSPESLNQAAKASTAGGPARYYQLAEFHFMSLSSANRTKILSFVRQAMGGPGQSKKSMS